MKTVVITGSAQGFGFEMAKVFRTHGFNVVLSDINKEMLKIAHSELLKIESSANVENATSSSDAQMTAGMQASTFSGEKTKKKRISVLFMKTEAKFFALLSNVLFRTKNIISLFPKTKAGFRNIKDWQPSAA